MSFTRRSRSIVRARMFGTASRMHSVGRLERSPRFLFMPDLNDPAVRAAQLRKEIKEHDRRYYDEAAPIISDAEYDFLFRELREIEERHPELVTEDSPTQRVGGKPTEGFRRVRHAVEMLGLDNLFAAGGCEPLRKFVESVQRELPGEKLTWHVETKIDGVAVSLRYED